MAERKFSGRTIKVGVVLATPAVTLQMRLMKVVGAGVERLPVILSGRGEEATEEQKTVSNAAAVAAFTDIFSNADPEEMVDMIQFILSFGSIERPSGETSRLDMDGDFSSENACDLYPVVIFILQAVLKDFFTGLLASGKVVK